MAVWTRIILHADMDAFFASVEQRDDPGLKGRPVVVGGLGPRGVVSTASYEARAFGVRSAMPILEARRRCPQAVFLAPDFGRYREASQRVMEVFRAFSPLVEPLSLDEAFLDMTGSEGLFGPPGAMGGALKKAVREATGGLTASVGLATTKFVAKVASDHRKPDGLTVVPPEGTTDFLRPLDASKIWGVGPRTRDILLSMGLATIGDVASASEFSLRGRLGESGAQVLRLARGLDDREVVPDRDTRSVGAEKTLDFDASGAESLLPHLRRAAERVAEQLRSEGFKAGAVRVKLKTSRFRLLTRQAPLSRPSDSWKEIFQAAEGLLPRFDLTEPMRLVGLAAIDLRPAGTAVQGELFEDSGRERERTLERTVDALRARFGPHALDWGGSRGGGQKQR
ncbi:MAG: DNA polymerase IV [Acidobacteriota bacterium]